MGRAVLRSFLGLAIVLTMAAAVAAAASREEPTTTQSEDSAVVANEGRALKACRSGYGLYRGKCYCKPGYGYNSGRRTCNYCPSGYYKPGYNFNKCQKCRSDYLVDDPTRSKCQPYCKKTNDFSTTYWKGYVAVAYPTYYYDWNGSGPKNYNSYTSAAEICESLRKEGYANYVPAIIRSSDRNTVSFLARFHFKCYPRGYYYWAWKSWNDNSLNGFGQCDRCSISNGDGKQYSGSRCFPQGGSSWKYPVICSKGCDKWCRSCKNGNCDDCEPGYTPNKSGDCVRDFSPFQEDK
jgi:hypothetical protein